MSSLDYMDVCRLCLVKDRVTVPIFEGEGNLRQIYLKISSCLQVKIAREDKLPQKICEECVYKVELFFDFWNQTLNVDKQLQQWLENVDKQGYAVATVLNQSGMKGEQSNENRLDGSVMQQVSGHQGSLNMGMDNIGVCMPMMMPNSNQQQITSVPMDTSGNSVQNVQVVAGSSAQTTHDQITQNQTNAPTQQEEEEESSEDEENSDDECDGDDGLPIKEESEEDPNNSRTIEPTTFVNVSLACEDPGPSGLQQQKMSDIQEMTQATDVDPKTGDSPMDPLYIPDSNNSGGLVLKISISSDSNSSVKDYPETQNVTARTIGRKKSKRTFECSICSKRFNLKHHMKRHMNVHKNRCKQCDLSFSLKKDLKLHESNVHGRPIHSCIMCPFVSEYRKNFMRHLMEIHNNKEWITCRDCDYIGDTRADWEVHMKREHKKKFFCFLCCSAFSRKVNTRSHMLWKHPQ